MVQTTHTQSKGVPAGKHDMESHRNIFNMCTPIMFLDKEKKMNSQAISQRKTEQLIPYTMLFKIYLHCCMQ